MTQTFSSHSSNNDHDEARTADDQHPLCSSVRLGF